MAEIDGAPGLCPEDWTLDDLKAVATDLEKNGASSKYYDKAAAAMDAGTEYSVTLTNGKELKYRIIGILHDDLTDGFGKAVLTFMATNAACGRHRMNADYTNVGGWEASELRGKMNSGEIWQLFPSDFQSKVVPVTKLTNNVGGTDKSATPTPTADRLFLLSYSEIVNDVFKTHSSWRSYSWLVAEGAQYEAFRGKVPSATDANSCLSRGFWWRERSCHPGDSYSFFGVYSIGGPSYYYYAANANAVRPAFCF